MEYPRTDIVFPGPSWGREEQTVFVHVPSVKGSPVLSVQAGDTENTPSTLAG